MKLSELKENQRAVIIRINGTGKFRKRLIEMGFIKGKTIKVIRYAPLKDPIEYEILGYQVSLRKHEADLVEVELISDYLKTDDFNSNNVSIIEHEKQFQRKITEKTHTIHIALVGNPNCGKTTLFNIITGAAEHVGNYSGVTVDAKQGKIKKFGYNFIITDLPGTYSLSTYSPEELYVRKYLFHQFPDIIINVVDASNLERNLYLTTQLLEIGIPVIIALNMYDELIKRGDKLNYIQLSKLLCAPVVPTIASTGFGVDALLKKAIETFEGKNPLACEIKINYGPEVEQAIEKLEKLISIPNNEFITNIIPPRFIAIKLLEKDKDIVQYVEQLENGKQILQLSEKLIKSLEKDLKEDTDLLIADARYGFIAGALRETYQPSSSDKFRITKIIDEIVTNKYLGFPIFLFFLWLMFTATFKLGEYPVKLLDYLIHLTSNIIDKFMPNGVFKDLLINGIISGVGSVIVFLPNILILFFFISLMEDSGYMARVAFIMDKLMHKIGLHGKSFIPLLMGFGCNVPAIMASRTIENRSDRLLTMLINPFMSCSARLTIYLLFVGTFFPKNPGLALFIIYLTGIVIAILVAIVFKHTLFKKTQSPFVMELPPYRMPVPKVLFKHVWHNGKEYLNKMGSVILIASILIWALENFPLNINQRQAFDKKVTQIEQQYNTQIRLNPAKKQFLLRQKDSIINALELSYQAHKQENSYIARLGKFIAPIMKPIGFDWKMTVSILAGISAKEIVVTTLSVLYQAKDNSQLRHILKTVRYEQGPKKGQLVFTLPTTLAFLIFIAIYFPCIATITAISKESGSWKWGLFSAAYSTTLAWILAFIVYHLAKLLV